MRRAIVLTVFGLLVLAVLPYRPEAQLRRVTLIDAIGLVDYTRKPAFKVGDWVQYHVTSSSAMGMKDDYVLTLLVGGEENFWGEDGFWLETWTEPKDGRPAYVASLVSYTAFTDSFPIQNLDSYARKLVTEVDLDGKPIQTVRRTAPESVRRRPNTSLARIEWVTDTLGVDTVMVPRGNYRCQKFRIRHGVRATSEIGDSTMVNETEEHRTRFVTLDVPVTSLVREDIEKWIRRQTWKAGESQDAPMIVREHSRGSARLMDFGNGLSPHMVPQESRKPLRKSQQTSTPAKRAVRGKSG